MFQKIRKYPEKVLHHGVVQTVALAAHTLDYIVVPEVPLVGVLAYVPVGGDGALDRRRQGGDLGEYLGA